MKVKKINTEYNELEIMGAMLLPKENFDELPLRLKKYPKKWWLQYKKDGSGVSTDVDTNGVITHYGRSSQYMFDNVVRPVLIINNRENSNFAIGDVFTFDQKEFEVINENMALCRKDIGQHYFNLGDKESIYEESDVKRYIDEWFTISSILCEWEREMDEKECLK